MFLIEVVASLDSEIRELVKLLESKRSHHLSRLVYSLVYI